MIRNLLYHIWPTKNGVWQWNVSQLLKRIDQFNGQRIVSVALDDNTDPLKIVEAAFKGTVKHFIRVANDPALGEMVSFPELMHRVENVDPNQITLYGHAKGVKYRPGTQPMVRRWTQVMYANMLDYPHLVDDSLQKHPIVGTFKKYGNSFGTLPPSWHYAGTFFWFRNSMIFNKPLWNRAPLQWWGTEAWPGIVVPQENADCLFYDGTAPEMQMYARGTWRDKIDPTWKAWQIKHAGLHRFHSYNEVRNSLTSRRVAVSGPQRSGTTIAAKMLASDLKLPLVNEEAFDTHNYGKFQTIITEHKEFVVQCPTMSAYLHQLPTDCNIVFLQRNLTDILRSQKRISWSDADEEMERDRYFDHTRRPIAVVKQQAWAQFQRIALGERAYDLDYESLRSHPMWIDPDARKTFGPRQTASCPYSQ